MEANAGLIVAAVVTAVGGVIIAVIQQFRKENTADHAYVSGLLNMLYKSSTRIEDKVQRVDERLTDHLESHPYEGMLDNDRAIHQDGVEGDSKVS